MAWFSLFYAKFAKQKSAKAVWVRLKVSGRSEGFKRGRYQ
jgi:hypothetical protein